jgi:hypothetical protein
MDNPTVLGVFARLAASLGERRLLFVSTPRDREGVRAHPMKARRWLQVCLVLLVASGCAQDPFSREWAEDVAGRWTGYWSGGGGGDFELDLQQRGPKAKGELRLTGAETQYWNGDIVGTVTGDVLHFSRWDGRLKGELTVAGDEMSGTVTFTPLSTSACCPGAYTHGTKILRLKRQP